MDPKFLTELDTRTIDDNTVVLLSELVFFSKVLGRPIYIPAGFVSDFASVPRFPFLYWLFGGTAKLASLPHDFLYQTHQCDGKFQADRVFLEAMEATGIAPWRRYDMYLGVVAGGWFAWHTGPRRYRRLNTPYIPVPTWRQLMTRRRKKGGIRWG